MRCLAQDLAALTRQHEEAQCQAWALFQEAEGLRRELAEAQGLMQEAQRKREDLEARWVQEKALEAGRMNQANEERDRYQRRVQCLREKLQEAREVAGMIPRPAAAESSPSDNTFSTSCEETSVEGFRSRASRVQPSPGLIPSGSARGCRYPCPSFLGSWGGAVNLLHVLHLAPLFLATGPIPEAAPAL
nr:uncharacterized protein LOC118094737 isoform X6 [Zootoca vivipara]XP_034991251.1 uncharacterized protein LOC118094737 isoform X6 [Zootoca vivipara]